VGRQALQLFPDRHDADGIARPRWTTDGLFELLLVTRQGGGLLIIAEEALAQLIPGLALVSRESG
jgi:hypothetical protein